jgi:hypothetical protein
MKWWFQHKKPESRTTMETGSASGPRYGANIADPLIPMPYGEQLVMIRKHWEQFERSRDAIPGIVQVSAHGFEAIAAMIGVILNDPTMNFATYSDTPTHPNTVLVRGQSTGDVPASLRKDGVVFNYHGTDYYTVADFSVTRMLEVLDYFWDKNSFTFVYGVYGASPLLTRREYYLSGPKSIPQGKNAFLVSTSHQSDSDPATIEIELQWDNGETYSTRLQSGVTRLEITRIK